MRLRKDRDFSRTHRDNQIATGQIAAGQQVAQRPPRGRFRSRARRAGLPPRVEVKADDAAIFQWDVVAVSEAHSLPGRRTSQPDFPAFAARIDLQSAAFSSPDEHHGRVGDGCHVFRRRRLGIFAARAPAHATFLQVQAMDVFRMCRQIHHMRSVNHRQIHVSVMGVFTPRAVRPGRHLLPQLRLVVIVRGGP